MSQQDKELRTLNNSSTVHAPEEFTGYPWRTGGLVDLTYADDADRLLAIRLDGANGEPVAQIFAGSHLELHDLARLFRGAPDLLYAVHAVIEAEKRGEISLKPYISSLLLTARRKATAPSKAFHALNNQTIAQREEQDGLGVESTRVLPDPLPPPPEEDYDAMMERVWRG